MHSPQLSIKLGDLHCPGLSPGLSSFWPEMIYFISIHYDYETDRSKNKVLQNIFSTRETPLHCRCTPWLQAIVY